MEKYVYIKKSIAKHFVEFADLLKSEEYNNLGETWQDYEENKWVLLNDKQVEFYQEHPGASPKEVWDRQIIVPVKTLEQAKQEKIWEIISYDSSNAVNEFTIGQQKMWLTVDERQQLATQISANEAVGRGTMTKWFNGTEYTFTIEQWKQMLVAVEVYAGDALNVTESHKAAVNVLDSIEAVEAYDYTTNYPPKLVF
jgi:hypothetical protein